MFTVGQAYDFEMLDTPDDEGQPTITTYPGRVVLEINGPLLRISERPQGEVIINTHSSVFVRATPVEKKSGAAQKFAPGLAPRGKSGG